MGRMYSKKEINAMFYVSEIRRSAPAASKSPLQEKVYTALEELRIPYERVDTDEAITMILHLRLP